MANYYPAKSKQVSDVVNASVDSILAVEAALWVREYMNDIPMFAADYIPFTINKRFDTLKSIPLLSGGVIDSLLAEYSADVIISFEYGKANISAYYTGDPFVEDHFQVAVYGFWRIYNTQKQAVVNHLLIRDTLYVSDAYAFEGDGFITGEEILSSVVYAGNSFAAKFAAQFVPTWRDEERIFFSKGSDQMKEATEFALQNQWIEAASLWQQVYHSGNKELSSKAAFNLALANEMNGNFEVALGWLSASIDTMKTPEAQSYKNIIEYRIKEISIRSANVE
ncbi:MAG: hypothetical protein JW783_04700 [Bacteroidales bacterium]|nr:hypothetical protein [Bacteroidales bacterium]MBN2750209.1 hypothetical protein [Bacteroidales bacterium]